MDENTDRLVELFQSLADGTRLRIISLIGRDEMSVGALADLLGESQPKISRHLAYMREHGLLKTRRDGKQIFYRISFPDDKTLFSVLAAVCDIHGSRPMVSETRSDRNTGISDIGKTEFVPNEEMEIFLL